MQNIFFSIITPVYNAEKYLPECLDSVLKQTYRSFEHILVDDGSTDAGGSICDTYAKTDSRVRVFHKENGGQLSARTAGISKAAGDYFLFLDADDYLEADTLEKLSAYIAESGADCLIFGYEWFGADGAILERVAPPEDIRLRLITDRHEFSSIVLNTGSYNSMCRKCVRSGVFDGRDYSDCFHIRSGEDLVQSLEILENAGSFYFVPDVFYHYRANLSSISKTVNFDSYRADFEVERRVFAFMQNSGLFSEDDYSRQINRCLDDLIIIIKSICRFTSSDDARHRALASIRDADFYKARLEEGYRDVELLAGHVTTSGMRRKMNEKMFRLLNARNYDGLIRLNGVISGLSKLTGRA